MSDLLYEVSEPLRCADEQELAGEQLGQAKQLTSGLPGQLNDTYGSAGAPISNGINDVLHARDAAIDALQQFCEQLAEFCRQAGGAYQNTDQQAAENLGQSLRSA